MSIFKKLQSILLSLLMVVTMVQVNTNKVYADGKTYTINYLDDRWMNYDDAKAAKAGDAIEVENSGMGPEAPTVTVYKKGGDSSWNNESGITIGFGSSTSMTIPAGYKVKDITTSGTNITIEIESVKTTPSASDFTFTAPTTLTAGETRSASVTTSASGMGNITVYYSTDKTNWSSSAPSNAGTYYVAIDVTEGDSYAAGTKITDDSWTFTLTEASSTTAVTGITLDTNSIGLYAGETYELEATIEPDDATNQNISWSSSDTNIATVSDDGEVTAVAVGSATITATTEDGGKTATCNVTVNVSPFTYDESTKTITFNGTGTLEDDVVDSAFYIYQDAVNVVINGYSAIGDEAFDSYIRVENTKNIENVIIGNTVTSIGEYAFGNCTKLTSITIPSSVISIKDAAFVNCTGLTSVIFDGTVGTNGSGIADEGGYRSVFYGVGTATNPVALIIPSTWTDNLPKEDGSWYGGYFEVNELTVKNCHVYVPSAVGSLTDTQKNSKVTEITSSSTALAAGWYIVKSDVTVSERIKVSGDVNIILSDNTTLTASSGITVSGDDNSLTIWCQTNGTGSLVATGDPDKDVAGIGGAFTIDYTGDGSNAGNGKNITINGGIITATGGKYGAGIGGSYDYDYGNGSYGSNITINAGTVTATGGQWAAGIGGGHLGDGNNITINGGTVTATGGEQAAGIGGGSYADGNNITINGGTITAIGGTRISGNYHEGGAGIGGGNNGAGSYITITGGTVNATGGGVGSSQYYNGGAGIGGGYYEAGTNIAITGGTITATGGYEASGIGSGNVVGKDPSNITVSSGLTVKAGDTADPIIIVKHTDTDDIAMKLYNKQYTTVTASSDIVEYSENINLTINNAERGKKLSDITVSGYDTDKLELADVYARDMNVWDTYLSDDDTLENGTSYYVYFVLKGKDDVLFAHNNSVSRYDKTVTINGSSTQWVEAAYSYNAETHEVNIPTYDNDLYYDAHYLAFCLEITTPSTGVTLSETSASLAIGSTKTLTATVAPSDATYNFVEWSSDNEDVATVTHSGEVTAVAAGTANITATTYDSGKTATCAVTVNAKITSNLDFTKEPDITTYATKTNGVQWDNDNKILTLDGAYIDVPDTGADEIVAIRLPDGTTVNVIDDTTVIAENSSRIGSVGIYGNGSIIFKGTGTLTTTAGAAPLSAGVFAEGDITINAKSKIVATSGDCTSSYSGNTFGITSSKGQIANNGTITAKAGASYSVSVGVCASTSITNTGTVIAEGNHGIKGNSLSLTGGSIKTKGSMSAVNLENALTGDIKVAGANETYISGTTKTFTNDGTAEYVSLTAILTPTVDDFIYTEPANLDANQKNPGGALIINKPGITTGSITNVYYSSDNTNWSTTFPTKIGKYYVAIDVAANDDYTAVEKLTCDTWNFKLGLLYIKGYATVGNTLTAYGLNIKKTDDGNDVTYQWSYYDEDNLINIEGATGKTFTVTSEYKEKELEVTATVAATDSQTEKHFYASNDVTDDDTKIIKCADTDWTYNFSRTSNDGEAAYTSNIEGDANGTVSKVRFYNNTGNDVSTYLVSVFQSYLYPYETGPINTPDTIDTLLNESGATAEHGFTGVSVTYDASEKTITIAPIQTTFGYTVTYNTDGGSTIDSLSETFKLPDPLPTPTKDEYTFGGWYTDSGLTTAATAGASITEDTTLYAKWTSVTSLDTITINSKPTKYTVSDSTYTLVNNDGTAATTSSVTVPNNCGYSIVELKTVHSGNTTAAIAVVRPDTGYEFSEDGFTISDSDCSSSYKNNGVNLAITSDKVETTKTNYGLTSLEAGDAVINWTLSEYYTYKNSIDLTSVLSNGMTGDEIISATNFGSVSVPLSIVSAKVLTDDNKIPSTGTYTIQLLIENTNDDYFAHDENNAYAEDVTLNYLAKPTSKLVGSLDSNSNFVAGNGTYLQVNFKLSTWSAVKDKLTGDYEDVNGYGVIFKANDDGITLTSSGISLPTTINSIYDDGTIAVNYSYTYGGNTVTANLHFCDSVDDEGNENTIVDKANTIATDMGLFKRLNYVVKVNSRILGTNQSIANVTGGGNITSGTGTTLTASTVTGYTFKGWYKNYSADNIGTQVTLDNNKYYPEANVTLTAVYEPNAGSTFNLTVSADKFKSQDDSDFIETFKSYNLAVSKQVTLNCDNTNNNFLYWANDNGKVLSTSPTYSFILGSSKNIHAVYSDTADTTWKVIFMSDYDQIIDSGSYSITDTISIPDGPGKLGYTFTKWVLDGTNIEASEENIRSKMNSDSKTIIVRPSYTVEENNILSLIIAYAKTVDGNYVDISTSSDPVSVTKGEDYVLNAPSTFADNVFSYWAEFNSEGTKLRELCYDFTYHLMPTSGDSNNKIYIKAIYDGSTAKVATTNVTYTANSDNTEVSINDTFYIPSDYTLVNTGIVRIVNPESTPTGESLVLDATGTKKSLSSLTSPITKGNYTLSLSITGSAEKTIYFRSFVQYIDSDNNLGIAYSDIYSVTKAATGE